MLIVTYLLIGLVIGSVSGVLGIGGGVLLVPALIWLCRFDPRVAAGTSLAVMIPPIGLPAAWAAYEKQQVDIQAALLIAGAFTVGAFASRSAVEYIPDHYFRMGFGLFMVFLGVRFIVHSNSEARTAAAGLTAALLAWLGFLGLKWLGKRPLMPPNVEHHIQEKHDQGWADRDYQI